MHELPVIRDILSIALAHAARNNVKKVVSVNLEIGAFCDAEPEWLARYFEIASRDTDCEGAKLSVARLPYSISCSACGRSFTGVKESGIPRSCPLCGSDDFFFESGFEYSVRDMEVEA